jgi:glycogen(starch) synthase
MRERYLKRDVLYCEIHGNIASAYETWKRGELLSSETGLTFSGQLFDACKSLGLSFHAVSFCGDSKSIRDERCTVENRKRFDIRIPLVGHQISMLLYATRLFFLALRVRPKTIFVCHGASEWGYLAILFLTGARLVPVLHNTLWPYGFPERGIKARFRRWGERLIWKRAHRVLAVSWAAAEQVGTDNVLVFKPSFPQGAFEGALPTTWVVKPRVLYASRLEEDKGIFDLLAMAKRLPHVEFAVCGTGSALHELSKTELPNVFRYGRLNREDLLEEYRKAHLVIVPTRSTFAEGFCMVVAEAVLLLRPVLTNEVVPAARVLKDAVVLAKTDDVESYVSAIAAMSAERYQLLVDGARGLREVVLDDSTSFRARARQALS